MGDRATAMTVAVGINFILIERMCSFCAITLKRLMGDDRGSFYKVESQKRWVQILPRGCSMMHS